MSLSSRLHDQLEPGGANSAPLAELLTSLTTDAARLASGTDIDETLFSDPFPLLNLLPPLLPRAEGAELEAIRACLELVAATSSAREVVIGLNNRLAALGGEGGEDVRDGGSDGGDDRELGASSGSADLSLELSLLIGLFVKVLPRIKTTSPERFLAGATESISRALERIEEDGALAGATGEACAECCLGTVALFVRDLAQSSWIEKGAAVCTEQLRQLLATAVVTLHRALPTDIAQTYFLSKHSRYRIPGRQMVSRPSSVDVWRETLGAATSLSLSPASLLSSVLSSTTSSDSPTTSVGLFIILAHCLASSPTSLQSIAPHNTPSDLLQSTMHILMLVRSSGDPGGEAQAGVQEALFWAWWCVESALRGPGATGVAEELLSTVSALSPDPGTRFLTFRLLSNLVIEGTAQEETQLMLLKDLVDDCPFESMRVAALGLLQEVLLRKFQPPLKPSLFLSPLLVVELGPSFLRAGPPALLTSPPPLSDFLELHSRPISQKLSLTYILISRDANNLTGIKSLETVEGLRREFLAPLRSRVDDWRIGDDVEDGRMGMELEMLSDSLKRVEEVLRPSQPS